MEPPSGYNKTGTHVASKFDLEMARYIAFPYGLYLYQMWRKFLKNARTSGRTQQIFHTICVILTFDPLY